MGSFYLTKGAPISGLHFSKRSSSSSVENRLKRKGHWRGTSLLTSREKIKDNHLKQMNHPKPKPLSENHIPITKCLLVTSSLMSWKDLNISKIYNEIMFFLLPFSPTPPNKRNVFGPHPDTQGFLAECIPPPFLQLYKPEISAIQDTSILSAHI